MEYSATDLLAGEKMLKLITGRPGPSGFGSVSTAEQVIDAFIQLFLFSILPMFKEKVPGNEISFVIDMPVEVYLALVPVVLGIVLASNSEPLFHLFGFLMFIGSTAGRALKSVVQGLLLTFEAEKLHSMNLLLYMAPIAAMILLPFTLYIEGNVAAVTLEKAKGDGFMVFLLIGNTTVAYLVNLTR
ncbi:PREDICTED: probable sugar phosphate/phosphate translocator At1g12500 [Nicotiana attenuata]|uniref:probable sugar phosphate/phosphate translocator At1g12500 n=1 Tax=Nicotiana attenuata TaxID=49451 RepID=UPI0009052493|nr:PREDICTED: probable sugar phosphate/phosphate translocator At1g12500 [Nicotiana attenuata]